MQWKLSEEQVAYQEAIRGWLEDAAPPSKVRGWLDGGDPSPFEERFAADGWPGVGIAEELGGQGGGTVELALTAEELARAGVPSAGWLATVLAIPCLASRTDLITSALAGEGVALLLPAEAVPDRPAASVRLSDDGTLSGAVPRVLAADRAARFVVPVTTVDGTVLRLVEAGASGVVVLPRTLLDRTRSVADVTLDNTPSTALEVDATKALAEVTDRSAVLIAADALGASNRMLDLAVEYSKQRKQFGVAIGSFQAVKHAAASIVVAVEAARSIVYFAAASVEEGDPEAALHAAAAKAQVTAEAAHTADTALTMHGAIGYTWEHDLQIFYKRAKLDAVLCGNPSAWNERIAVGLSLI